MISLIDRKPGDIQVLTDFMLEDYKNFPKVPEFGEETARYIRKEMEDTWGSDHLSVLPEDEAQHWILGVGPLFSLLDQEWFLVPSKTPQVLQDHIKRLNTKYKQASCRFPLEFLQLLQSKFGQPMVSFSSTLHDYQNRISSTPSARLLISITHFIYNFLITFCNSRSLYLFSPFDFFDWQLNLRARQPPSAKRPCSTSQWL